MDQNNNNFGEKKLEKNIKDDPERYEAYKKEDRLRKQNYVNILIKNEQNDKAVADELKRQKREQQRRFKAKERTHKSCRSVA